MENTEATIAPEKIAEYTKGLAAYIEMIRKKDPGAFFESFNQMDKCEFINSAMRGYDEFLRGLVDEVREKKGIFSGGYSIAIN